MTIKEQPEKKYSASSEIITSDNINIINNNQQIMHDDKLLIIYTSLTRHIIMYALMLYTQTAA